MKNQNSIEDLFEKKKIISFEEKFNLLIVNTKVVMLKY